MSLTNETRFLVKRGTTKVFAYTPQLAKRSDMLECDKNGKILNSAESESDAVVARLTNKINELEILLQKQDGTIKLYRHVMKKHGIDPNSIDPDTYHENYGDQEEEPETNITPNNKGLPVAPVAPLAPASPVGDGNSGGGDNGSSEATVEEVIEAIGKLKADKSGFNKDKTPKIDALEKILDKDVTMEVRNAAWEAFQKAE